MSAPQCWAEMIAETSADSQSSNYLTSLKCVEKGYIATRIPFTYCTRLGRRHELNRNLEIFFSFLLSSYHPLSRESLYGQL